MRSFPIWPRRDQGAFLLRAFVSNDPTRPQRFARAEREPRDPSIRRSYAFEDLEIRRCAIPWCIWYIRVCLDGCAGRFCSAVHSEGIARDHRHIIVVVVVIILVVVIVVALPSSWRSSSVHSPADGVIAGSSSHTAKAICRKKHARGSYYSGRYSRGFDDRREDSPSIDLGDFETLVETR